MEREVAGGDGLIQVMPDPLANQIAAGEVVQRPASVAKECIENALDAGATSIQLIVKKAGSELVQVIDNGCGMSPQDAQLCFRRHATSKIRAVTDLNAIRTLGFRGEALASIAAVAQVELQTKRTTDDAAFCVHVEGSEITSAKPCAGPNGTSVSVKNLFYNVPARRTFLKTPATEFKHLTETFQKLALSNPKVGFRLIHNGNEIYRLAAQEEEPAEALHQRIVDLLGKNHSEKLLPVEQAHADVSVHGFAGTPSFYRKNRDYQYLFVNGRPVDNRYLAHAVKKAYGSLLDDGTFPFFALFLELDPARVDVNVHPAKEEVKFDDQQGLYAFVRSAAREALADHQTAPDFSGSSHQDEANDEDIGIRGFQTRRTSFSTEGSGRSKTEGGDPFDASSALYNIDNEGDKQPATGQTSMVDAQPESRAFWQVANSYILVHEGSSVTLIDQRAAHKRVLFEKIMGEERSSRSTQTLLFPSTIELSATEFGIFESIEDDLDDLGFDANPFGDRTVVVRGVPPGVNEGDAEDMLKGLVQDLTDELQGASREERARKIAKAMVARQAIHRGKDLAREEVATLLTDLFSCEMPYIDPHGKPVMIQLGKHDLADVLQRIAS